MKRHVHRGGPAKAQFWYKVACIQTLYLSKNYNFLENLAKHSRLQWVFGTVFKQIQFCSHIFLQETKICWRLSLWRHGSQTLCMLVLYLISVVRGDSKRNIGTKINIKQGFILKIWQSKGILITLLVKSAWHDPQHHPPFFVQTHCDFGTKSLVIFIWLLWWNLVWIFQIL